MNWNYLVIEGNIGAGKTTLATLLAQEFNARLVLEQFAENPFLPVFYTNPEKYAFPLELSFVAERYQQLKDVLSQADLFRPRVVADYYLLKSLIFARVNLPEMEFNLFRQLFNIVYDSLPQPDAMIFLNSDIPRLQRNIQQRGRTYEQAIEDTYLENIRLSYVDALKQISHIPVLLIDSTAVDFVGEQAVFGQIKELLEEDYPNGLNYVKLSQ
jgi:deoxyadenosine/deoxycytidine kinase